MGVVYKARHSKLDRLVALKMILAGGHAGAGGPGALPHRGRGRRPPAAPNIVQIYEVGEHDGLPYFSLEFCDGGSLAQKLDGTPLPPQEAARLVEKLARGMHAAHRAKASSTATSSRPTCCWRRTARRRSPTSAWPSSWTTPARRNRARSWARRATWPRSRPAARAKEIGPGGRHLRAGRDPLRAADGPAAVQGRDAAGHDPAGGERRAGAAVAVADQRCRATWRRSA